LLPPTLRTSPFRHQQQQDDTTDFAAIPPPRHRCRRNHTANTGRNRPNRFDIASTFTAAATTAAATTAAP
jgi:hypothetical protein